jgi:hypothetical protein
LVQWWLILIYTKYFNIYLQCRLLLRALKSQSCKSQKLYLLLLSSARGTGKVVQGASLFLCFPFHLCFVRVVPAKGAQSTTLECSYAARGVTTIYKLPFSHTCFLGGNHCGNHYQWLWTFWVISRIEKHIVNTLKVWFIVHLCSWAMSKK